MWITTGGCYKQKDSLTYRLRQQTYQNWQLEIGIQELPMASLCMLVLSVFDFCKSG